MRKVMRSVRVISVKGPKAIVHFKDSHYRKYQLPLKIALVTAAPATTAIRILPSKATVHTVKDI